MGFRKQQKQVDPYWIGNIEHVACLNWNSRTWQVLFSLKLVGPYPKLARRKTSFQALGLCSLILSRFTFKIIHWLLVWNMNVFFSIIYVIILHHHWPYNNHILTIINRIKNYNGWTLQKKIDSEKQLTCQTQVLMKHLGELLWGDDHPFNGTDWRSREVFGPIYGNPQKEAEAC